MYFFHTTHELCWARARFYRCFTGTIEEYYKCLNIRDIYVAIRKTQSMDPKSRMEYMEGSHAADTVT